MGFLYNAKVIDLTKILCERWGDWFSLWPSLKIEVDSVHLTFSWSNEQKRQEKDEENDKYNKKGEERERIRD